MADHHKNNNNNNHNRNKQQQQQRKQQANAAQAAHSLPTGSASAATPAGDQTVPAAPSATSAQITQMMSSFWQQTARDVEHGQLDFKFHQLPLARVKKVMKADEDAKMISAEAPMIFSKACEIFILELTMRAWIHAEEHKRRTLQRSDVATAISKSDQYDFLIDIVPREEINKPAPSKEVPSAAPFAYYQNPAQFISSLPLDQQQQILAYQQQERQQQHPTATPDQQQFYMQQLAQALQQRQQQGQGQHGQDGGDGHGQPPQSNSSLAP
ncbi:hypothetical protein HDU88_005840 [Geranomyces variabilis]|nr:hypothetical protein HDU88_005840 [Geranomyces variabilis]